MDWATISPLLLDVFSQMATSPIVGAIPFQAVWENRPKPMISPDYQFELSLKVLRSSSVGSDEQRFAYEAMRVDEVSGLAGRTTATICGIRRVTLQLKATVLQNTDELWALSILDRVATQLDYDRFWNRLRDEGNCVFYDWEDAIDHSVPADGRIHSIATMDMYLYAAINDVDSVPFGWIEKVKMSSQIDPATDFTDKLFPPG